MFQVMRKMTPFKPTAIAAVALAAISAHLVLRFGVSVSGGIWGHDWATVPLLIGLAAGGVPLVLDLAIGLMRGEFSADLLAGLSIATSVVLGEYLAGTLVVLMLSGGQTLES